MVLAQFLGQGAFIVASLVLGLKLLLLWRRTREVPELTLGLSFVVGGAIGYVSWFVLGIAAMKGASASVVHAIALVGLAASCSGATLNGIGVARVFRGDARWPLVGVGALGLVMAVGWATYWRATGLGSMTFWISMIAATPIYAWGAFEALSLALALHKRARIGLADPIVVNRLAQWGVSGIAVVGMIVIALVSRMIHGPTPQPWTQAVAALLGLLAAATIWMGFFPPAALRTRLQRAYAE
jgi:hypothetical protein